jgi:Helix-turn-helix.
MKDSRENPKLSGDKEHQVNYKAISGHMRDKRRTLNLTQGKVAEKMLVTTNFYSTLETGANKVNLLRLLQFAVITNTPINELVAGAYPDLPSADAKEKALNTTRIALDKLLDQCSEEALIAVYDICHAAIKHLP